MTTCIAAQFVDEDQFKLLLCSDTKIGTWMAGGELDSKVRWARHNWPSLISGTVSKANALLATYQENFGQAELTPQNIFDLVSNSALIHKAKLADEYVMRTFGFSYEHLRKNGKKELPASLLYETFVEIKNLDLECDVIISGFIGKEAYIFVVNHDGTVVRHEHFAAVGTGGVIAESSLYQRKQHRFAGPIETLYHLYEAKRLSEIAEGVGQKTFTLVIGPSKTKEAPVTINGVSEDGYKKLKSFYSEFALKTPVLDGDYKQFFM